MFNTREATQREAGHQLQSRFQYARHWSEGDVLVWDNLWTLHAEADYRADEPRLIRRCQAMANLVSTPEFAHLAKLPSDEGWPRLQ